MASNNQDESSKTIGNIDTDNYLSNNIYGILENLRKYTQSVNKVYPSLADNVLVTGGTAAWELGSFVEIIPVNTITNYFNIHCMGLTYPSAVDCYQIELYSGGSGDEVLIAQVKVCRDTNQGSVSPTCIITPIIAPNTRISAKIATKGGGNDTITMALGYHEY